MRILVTVCHFGDRLRVVFLAVVKQYVFSGERETMSVEKSSALKARYRRLRAGIVDADIPIESWQSAHSVHFD